MNEEAERDPLEGFQVTDYDEKSEEVTIEIHRLVMKYSAAKLAKKCVEIIEHGPSVNSICIKIRSDDQDRSDPQPDSR